MFPRDSLGLPDMALDKAWLGFDLFSLKRRIFLDEDLTRSQMVELKCSRDLVMEAQHARKWAVFRNLIAVIQDSSPLGWATQIEAPK